MEKWYEIFKGQIPTKNYSASITVGEESGLLIELISGNTIVRLDFGVVRAFRILDEGIVQSDMYSENEIEKFKADNFKNIIYHVVDGNFNKEINRISLGYSEIMNMQHYILITMNYNIDIVSEEEPSLDIISL